MQAITIADRLWLEPTMLGATLNYAAEGQGLHFRVGIGFVSLAECDRALKGSRGTWVLKDNSLRIDGTDNLTLTFCPGTEMEHQLVLSGEELQTFKHAIRFLTLASVPQYN